RRHRRSRRADGEARAIPAAWRRATAPAQERQRESAASSRRSETWRASIVDRLRCRKRAAAVSRLFDSYLVVDWSAAAVPRRGSDSIWFVLVEGGRVALIANPATRHGAEAALARCVAAERRAGRRVLVGFDFPFGYAEGFAQRLGHTDWRGVWDELAKLLEDRA